MITGRWYPQGETPAEAISLWSDVFQRACDDSEGFVSRAAVLFDEGGALAAAGKMYYDDGAFWLDSLAVREDLRGRGYGDLLARMMLDRALRHAAREIRLYAARGCEGFFRRYGFMEEPGGDALMSVKAEDMRLGGCG